MAALFPAELRKLLARLCKRFQTDAGKAICWQEAELPTKSLQIPWSMRNRLCLCGSRDEKFFCGKNLPAGFPAQGIWQIAFGRNMAGLQQEPSNRHVDLVDVVDTQSGPRSMELKAKSGQMAGLFLSMLLGWPMAYCFFFSQGFRGRTEVGSSRSSTRSYM